jgi:hypothetical protein
MVVKNGHRIRTRDGSEAEDAADYPQHYARIGYLVHDGDHVLPLK